MSSILDQIKPDTAETIAAEARARGLSVDDYLKSLLPQSNGDYGSVYESKLSLTEVDQLLDELAEGGDNLMPLPSDFSRKDIYHDHD
jgi:hypothetical protein